MLCSKRRLASATLFRIFAVLTVTILSNTHLMAASVALTTERGLNSILFSDAIRMLVASCPAYTVTNAFSKEDRMQINDGDSLFLQCNEGYTNNEGYTMIKSVLTDNTATMPLVAGKVNKLSDLEF